MLRRQHPPSVQPISLINFRLNLPPIALRGVRRVGGLERVLFKSPRHVHRGLIRRRAFYLVYLLHGLFAHQRLLENVLRQAYQVQVQAPVVLK